MAIHSIDHVMIAVHDLEEAALRYARVLGLVATGGGDHPGRGTRNRIIVLDSCYLELIALAPDAPPEHWLAGFLAGGEGLVRLALATGDLPATVARLKEQGAPLQGPLPGQLVSPDGASRGWHTAFPSAEGFADWQLPFLIEHDSSGEERRRRLAHPHPPAAHLLGARDVPAAVIAVAGLAEGLALYSQAFGLHPAGRSEDEMLDAQTAVLPLAAATLTLAAPRHAGQGPLARGLAVRGDGLFAITLTVDDLQSAVDGLRARGAHVRVHEPDGMLTAAQLDPAQTCGARIKLVAA